MVFDKECTMQWSPRFYSFWKVECLQMMPSWCRQVNWGNCGIPWVNCAVLCVKDYWKGSSDACAVAHQNCAVFPSGMTSHSKIAQFNWECIAPYNLLETRICVRVVWLEPCPDTVHRKKVVFVRRCAKTHSTRQGVPKQVLAKRCFLILRDFLDVLTVTYWRGWREGFSYEQLGVR